MEQFSSRIKASSVYETLPQYELNQPIFLNQAVEIETDLSPHQLLKEIKSIEDKLGRQPTYRFGPRIVDIDILYYGQEKVEIEGLTIPHPMILERSFVLEPLCEIAPNFKCPKTGKTVQEMWNSLRGGSTDTPTL